MSLIRKHGAVLQAWACLDLVVILTLRRRRKKVCNKRKGCSWRKRRNS